MYMFVYKLQTLDEVCVKPSGPYSGAYPGFCNMKQLETFLLPAPWMEC